MSNLDTQNILTVGAAYHLRQRADGKGPNVAAIVRDCGLSREVVKQAIGKLETDHKDWLDEYRDLCLSEAKKELVSDEVTRLRSKMSGFANTVLDRTRDNFLKLHDACQQAALKGGTKSEDEFQALKIKQYERTASLRVLSQITGIVERLEAATKFVQGGPIGMQNFNFGLTEEGKKKLESSIERSYDRINAVPQNGN